MYFASDNSGPAHPEVMDALVKANQGFALPYGEDEIMKNVREKIREVFEAPEAAVYLVATGTAANSIALACITQPYETVFCSSNAHIHEDECNAPEFFTSGAKLTLASDGDKITTESLRAAIEAEETRGVHGPQRGSVSITQVTEKGAVYSLEELNALCGVAKQYDLPVHLDGARFANALMKLGCTPAEMTWKAGVDVVSFGGTKNGCMGVEAVIMFDPKRAWEFELRRKRGAHLFSKHRYLSAQMEAYLKDDLWKGSAARANGNCARLVAGLRSIEAVRFDHEPDANIVFCSLPRSAHQRLLNAGAVYYVLEGDHENGDPDELLPARLVCDWSVTEDQIDQFIDLARG